MTTEQAASDSTSTPNASITEQPERLLLEAPTEENTARRLEVNGSSLSLYDELGPSIVSSDGTLSRIGNWKEMKEDERARVLRVLGARNKIRLEQKKAEMESQTVEGGPQAS